MSEILQTDYSFFQKTGFAGQEFGYGPKERLTAVSDEVIAFGLGVVYSAQVSGNGNFASVKVALPSASTDQFVGIALHRQKPVTGQPDYLTVLNTSQKSEWEVGYPIPVGKRGTYRVLAEQSVSYGDSVFLRYDSGGNDGGDVGSFRADADNDGSDHAVQLNNAIWASERDKDNLAIVELY